ncbi:serine/threonine-protein kinase [Sphaerospermopsis torques-reginae]|uniref:non-specific serine/threonine protein kinase n=1 Tax=Sphaerospermopsis torques-reginae ITEP-024 TaxID=984208 RepID=A0ABX8X055_9CYAN|nr:serine/threonine-protein kinase [Sphaerospermopsis torques-reginae]QYX32081.1 protein kinase [Sphaerospermopsis torques-reginae ITEP-024]
MTNLYCSQGHQNPAGSKFCLQCGEKIIETPVNSGIKAGQTLGDRYVIVRQLGQGGFGKTYLAEDSNRFREACVLKEFSPQVQTPYVVQKAEELFQREASVLYQLQHPQIPRFRELLRINLQGKESLFLVQDHVAGETYNSLLNTRKQQGLKFTEIEVRQLLEQLLPVLEYIHNVGVIHRDISPDNLILRSVDQLPVLIDFGGVKQVAQTVASQYYQSGEITSGSSGTLLGKIGFAPPEQMQTGLVYPHSDLYALAVTVLVLLTGKLPQDLIDTQNLQWLWRREISLSPLLGDILDKMLSPRPSDRYQSARQILDALNGKAVNNTPNNTPPVAPTVYPATQPPKPTTSPTTAGTVAVSPPKTPAPPPVATPTPQNTSIWTATNVFIVTIALCSSIGLLWWGISNRRNNQYGSNPDVTLSPTPRDTPTNSGNNYSPEERERKQRLSDRRQQLGIDNSFYVSLINQLFWEKNPNIQGRTLKDTPEDEDLRKEWDRIASRTLDKLSLLSSRARRQMGTYTPAERDRWKVEVNRRNVSSRALYDLGDATFFRVFPEYRGKNFIEQPIGQVWHAFVSDKLNAILSNSAFARIVFDPGTTGKTVSGNLQPGGGKVFIAGLAKDQIMEVKLDASSQVLLSIYSPSGKVTFLEDSTVRTVSKTLPETGFYEFVVVSTASKSTDYQLTVTAENPPEPEPTPTETPTETPTPEPTETPEPTPTETP